MQNTLPVRVCPDAGEPLSAGFGLDPEPPDYEEGLETGLLPEDVRRLLTEAEGKRAREEAEETGMRSYVPSTLPSGRPELERVPRGEAAPLPDGGEPVPQPSPTPTPRPR